MWNKIEETTFADIDLLYFSSFSLKKKTKKHGFIQACNSSEKVLIVEEELDAVDIHEHKKFRGFT